MKIQVVIEATSIQEYTEAIQALAAGYTVAPTQITAEDLVKPEAVTTYGKAKQAVEQDTAEDKPAEVKYIETKDVRRLKNKIGKIETPKAVERLLLGMVDSVDNLKQLKLSDLPVFENQLDSILNSQKPAEAPKEEKDVTTPKAEDKVSEEKTEAPKSKYGFPAVKQIAMKLSKITDGKAEVKFLLEKFGADKLSSLQEENYDEFHELASNAIAEHDKVQSLNTQADEKVEETVPTEEEHNDKEVTLEMIRSKAKELSVAGYKDEIKAALKAIGAPALTKIPKDQYASFYETMGSFK